MAATPSNRKQAHRTRSPSPSSTLQSQPSTPALQIKGSYTRPTATSITKSTHSSSDKLLQSAVKNAAASASASSAKKTILVDPPDSSSKAQFEQQQDFISFGASPSPSPEPEPSRGSGPGGRGTPRDGGRRGKRKMEDRDEDAAGTKRLRNREKGRSTPWCDEPGVEWDKCETAIDMLNAETRSFITYISPSPIEHELRLWTIELIRRTIKSKYPDADVQCFGSVGTGLYLPGGDIDLVLLSPSLPAPPLKPSSSLLHRLASLLLTSSLANPSSLVVIAKARVPIVKFTTRFGGFSVDLSVNQKNGVDAAVRVRGMLEDFSFREQGYVEPGLEAGSRTSSAKSSRASTPAFSASVSGKGAKKGKGKRKAADQADSSDEEEGEEGEDGAHPVDYGVARSLVLLVKAFLAQRGMNEVFTGGLGSYSIICMVVSFLQLHPRIQSSHLNPNRNLGLLFVELLELYGKHFNYDEAGITLRGRGGYYNKHDKGWYRAQQPYLLSIEDPNDPQNDVSGGSHAIIRVRQTLAGGFDTLTATLLYRQSLLSTPSSSASSRSFRPASSFSSSSAAAPSLSSTSLPNADSSAPSATQQSILGSIIGMTRAGVEARDANTRLHSDGVLQRLLKRSAAAGDGSTGGGSEGGKKEQKRIRKEEKERKKKERTVARLERRMEEKEERRERKERKKRERILGKDGLAVAERKGEGEEGEVVKVTPLVGQETVEEAKGKAASLEGLAPHDDDEGNDESDNGGFVIDTVGSGRSAWQPSVAAAADESMEEDDPEESRYSLGIPAIARPAKSTQQHTSTTTTTGGGAFTSASSNSSDDDEDDEDDDGDVILGGTGGDFVHYDRIGRASSNVSSSVDEGEGSSEEVEAELVPHGAAARKRVKVEAPPSPPPPPPPPPPPAAATLPVEGKGKGKGKGKRAEKEEGEKEAKRRKRIEFWGKKGPKE
ncbi:hypothetical protein JCM11641_006482 [Rhodosporidiobolus odoratus]